MRLAVLFFLFSASMVDAQEQSVSPDAAVITLSAPCTAQAQAECVRDIVITRAQFEQLAKALQPDLSHDKYLTVANTYVHNLRMAEEAERRGIDSSVVFEQQLHYARLQLLAQDLNLALQQEANQISDAELHAFYESNQAALEQATLERIVVPHTARGSRDADAMSKLAETLRLRCVQGVASDDLQRDANVAAGIDGVQVQTRLEQVRRSTLTPRHEIVMNLHPGEVSAVISDPEGAHFIYRMVDKQFAAFDAVKTEIHNTIASRRYRDSMKKYQGDVVFSDAYFNPPSASANGRGKRAQPADQAVSNAAQE